MSCVDVTSTSVRIDGAVAVQISDVPSCSLVRCLSVHVRPAPVTVSSCAGARRDPSDATKATSSSPGALVLNSGVVTMSLPSTNTTVSTLTPDAGAPDEMTSATALPEAACEPPSGDWLMTRPAGTVELAAVLIVPTVRPAPVIALDAAAWLRPATFGTVTGGCGPDETTRPTALPAVTCVPASGVWLMTVPAGTVALDVVVAPPTTRTARGIAEGAAGVSGAVAAVGVVFTTFGTTTSAGPDETTSATPLPVATCVPAAGFWLMTDPAGTVPRESCVIAPAVSPALVIAPDAAVCVRPTTLGAATSAGAPPRGRLTSDATDGTPLLLTMNSM